MNATFTNEDAARVQAINKAVPGWSGAVQYAFFKAALAERPGVRDILMLGVYQGRDLAYLLDVWDRYHPGANLTITGVDKFSDTPCDDWPEAKRGLGWKAAGFGEPPSREKARNNLAAWPTNTRVALMEMDDAAFLHGCTEKYDLIYIDTSHDYECVKRQLEQVRKVCRDNTLLCGDDYSDQGTWGVKRAVAEMFRQHEVFGEWIWHSPAEELNANRVQVPDVFNKPQVPGSQQFRSKAFNPAGNPQ